MATNWPREVCSAVSVAQTGVIAFNMPVPIPLKIRAATFQLSANILSELLRTADHPGMILSRALKASTDNRPSGRDSNSVYASEFITDVTTEEGAKKSTWQVVHSDLEVSAWTTYLK